MKATETIVIYGFIGISVMLVLLRQTERRGWASFLHAGLWLVLWPFFAPLIFGAREQASPKTGGTKENTEALFDPRLRQAERALVEALSQLDGVAEDVLAPELARIHTLTQSLVQIEVKLQDMNALLQTPAFDAQRVEQQRQELIDTGCDEQDPRRQSLQIRRHNIERLLLMRNQTAENLERALLKMEEISGQLQLLRFAAKPETEVTSLIRDIAASVEGAAEGLLDTPEPAPLLSPEPLYKTITNDPQPPPVALQ